MITLAWWSCRSERKERMVAAAMADFGLKPAGRGLAVGALTEQDRASLERRLSAMFSARTDRFLLAPVCGACERSLLREHPWLGLLGIAEFEEGFRVY